MQSAKNIEYVRVVYHGGTEVNVPVEDFMSAWGGMENAASTLPELRDNFARYANNTEFTHASQTPETAPGGWRVTMAAGTSYPKVIDDATYGRGLVGTGAGLYYLASDLGVGVPIRSIVMDLTLKATGSSTGNSNGITIGMGPASFCPSAGNIGLQIGQLHFSFGSGGFGGTIFTEASTNNQRAIIPDGESNSAVGMVREDATAGLARNCRYKASIVIIGDTMIFSMAGRTWVYRDSAISDFALNSFFFETAGPTNYDDVWILHSISVNDDTMATMAGLDGAGFGRVLSRTGEVMFPPSHRQSIVGQAQSFTKGNRPGNAAHANADFYYTEKGLITRPWGSSDGELYAVGGSSSSNTSSSPSGTDQNWEFVTLGKCANTGDWCRTEYVLNFPNSNSKTFKFKTTGAVITELTMPAFTDSGVGKMIVTQHRTSTITNLVQITLEVVTDSTAGTVKKWIRNYSGSDGDGNKAVRMVFTGTASGDAVILGSQRMVFVKNP